MNAERLLLSLYRRGGSIRLHDDGKAVVHNLPSGMTIAEIVKMLDALAFDQAGFLRALADPVDEDRQSWAQAMRAWLHVSGLKPLIGPAVNSWLVIWSEGGNCAAPWGTLRALDQGEVTASRGLGRPCV